MSAGPVVVGFDGSEQAWLAIEEAGQLLRPDAKLLIVCVWQPFDVGFVPVDGESLNADQVPAVRAAARRTAERGAELARSLGFDAEPVEREASPIWKGIAEVAEEQDASLIVLCAHCHGRLGGVLSGSIAASITAHSERTVLLAHPRSENGNVD
jgi:nucleotide-binding universal stress UspA family protein